MSSSEYNQLLKFLYFEGYADSYEEAENLLEEMSDEEEFYIDEAKKEFPSDKVKRQSAKHMRNFLTRPNSAVGQRSKQKSKKMDAIRSTVEVGDDPRNTMHGQDLRKIREDFEERKLAHSFPLKPSERRSVENIRARLNNQEPETPTRSARKVEPVQPRKRRKLEFEVREDFDIITEFLFVEGYAETIENAELIAESISEEWVNEILDEKYARAMDTTGRGPDHRTRFPKFHTWDKDPEVSPQFTRRRARTNDKKIDPYFSGRRKRKTQRRQGTGGFNAE